ncbi:hypothetical protein JTE90_025727 [Oedothorax gibbosus]|uniref:Uncharacterized protein n=1 Tax=Oedothorax gibbosus TaxID=931172 RepID=A0AAV6U316_9ARAC|nr:hypothetical protein JTE90_025727 [Oedothorax gibbosus]
MYGQSQLILPKRDHSRPCLFISVILNYLAKLRDPLSALATRYEPWSYVDDQISGILGLSWTIGDATIPRKDRSGADKLFSGTQDVGYDLEK